MTDHARLREAQSVQCPRCDAEVGQPCWARWHGLRIIEHSERVTLARTSATTTRPGTEVPVADVRGTVAQDVDPPPPDPVADSPAFLKCGHPATLEGTRIRVRRGEPAYCTECRSWQ